MCVSCGRVVSAGAFMSVLCVRRGRAGRWPGGPAAGRAVAVSVSVSWVSARLSDVLTPQYSLCVSVMASVSVHYHVIIILAAVNEVVASRI